MSVGWLKTLSNRKNPLPQEAIAMGCFLVKTRT